MSEYAAQRRNMIDGQVRANDVTDKRLQDAMAAVDRERFVPPHLATVAYSDICILVAPNRYLPDPRSFAKLAQLAGVGSSDRVLDVGCATGYSSAVLSRLAREVVALEENRTLSERAREQLVPQANVAVAEGTLKEGWLSAAPFDVIFVNGGMEARPDALLAQLANGGRLVGVILERGHGQANLFVNNGGAIGARPAFDAQLPVLPGFEKARGFVF